MFYVGENGKGSIQSIIPDELEIGVSKEWAKLFLENWNRAVKLWDKGNLFSDNSTSEIIVRAYQGANQREYARICCNWMLPNGMVEPHCVAEGL